MFRNRVLPALFALSLLHVPAAFASDNEAIFLNAQGKLVIPHLRLGNEIYYVILNRTNPNGYNFNLMGASVTKITPKPGDDWASPAEVVGDWAIPAIPGATLSIFASGNYNLFAPADDECAAGTETGTWTIDERTGVFFAVAVTDANGECGLSHPDGAMRFQRIGANLKAIIVEQENGVQVGAELTLTPR